MSFTEEDNTPQKNTGTLHSSGEGHFYAPLDASSQGRLLLDSGVDRMRLRAGAAPDALLQAYFGRHHPHVSHGDGIVRVSYRRLPLLAQLLSWRPSPAELRLNAAVPWEFEFRGGVSQLNGDLSQLAVRSLDLLSGVTQMRLTLSTPAETTFIYISGGISHSTITVPLHTSVRLQIDGGASALTFAGQHFGAIGGETSLQTANFDRTASRYDICIGGGASHLKIDRISTEV